MTRLSLCLLIALVLTPLAWAAEIIHDAEHYILAAQNGEN